MPIELHGWICAQSKSMFELEVWTYLGDVYLAKLANTVAHDPPGQVTLPSWQHNVFASWCWWLLWGVAWDADPEQLWLLKLEATGKTRLIFPTCNWRSTNLFQVCVRVSRDYIPGGSLSDGPTHDPARWMQMLQSEMKMGGRNSSLRVGCGTLALARPPPPPPGRAAPSGPGRHLTEVAKQGCGSATRFRDCRTKRKLKKFALT